MCIGDNIAVSWFVFVCLFVVALCVCVCVWGGEERFYKSWFSYRALEVLFITISALILIHRNTLHGYLLCNFNFVLRLKMCYLFSIFSCWTLSTLRQKIFSRPHFAVDSFHVKMFEGSDVIDYVIRFVWMTTCSLCCTQMSVFYSMALCFVLMIYFSFLSPKCIDIFKINIIVFLFFSGLENTCAYWEKHYE